MEDILDLYHESYNPERPVVCFDESSKQLISEKRVPMPILPGKVTRYDYEYTREGVRNIFMFCEPLTGQRHVEVTQRRTKADWADCMQQLVDELYPDATCIRVVMDNLNTHNPAALYEFFEPRQAKRLLDHLEFHYTPKHGSWLNIAEIEFSALARQCINRRIPDEATLKQEIAAWEARRNAQNAKVDWQFTTKAARIKLKKLYPSLHDC